MVRIRPWSLRPLRHEDRPAHAWAANVGAGLATVGADNDPGGILTYSLAGAQYGFDLLWLCVLSVPSMVALQWIATRVGAVTGRGLTENMREHYARWLFLLAVARFLFANTLNIAADVLAMGEAAQLIFNGPVGWFALVFGGLSLAMQWCVPYARYARVGKWLCVTLFCYAGTLLVSDVPWRAALWDAFVPHITWSEHFFAMVLAVLGTTVSPYLLFSQAEQEVEAHPRGSAAVQPGRAPLAADSVQLQTARRETLIRTMLSNVFGALILGAAAVTLHVQHASLAVSRDAAQSIAPVAHGYATQILGIALLGTAMLALPPLAGSAAHAAASTFGWTRGAERDRRIALTLVGLMTGGALIAILLHACRVDAVRVCYWSALANGMTVTPVLFLLVLLSRHREAVGALKTHVVVQLLSWFAVMATGAALTAHTLLEIF